MTVHGAKGLQAPIVFLPDTLQAPTQSPRILWTADGLPLWKPRSDSTRQRRRRRGRRRSPGATRNTAAALRRADAGGGPALRLRLAEPS